jgi:hypothetical protein
MATNLRLSARTAQALREASHRSGRSQQELLREAVDRYLGLDEAATDRERAIALGVVKRPTPFQDIRPTIALPTGLTSLDLLDRDDR